MDETASAQALRESEELHRITLLNMSDAVFITTADGIFTFICPNVDVIFGYSHHEVRAMERIPRLLGRELIDPADLARNGELRNIEHQIATKSGAPRALLVHVKQVAIGGGTILYACRDVTERKQSEQALRRNEERLTMALEAASMGMWDWDLPSGEMNWSAETHRLLGDASRTHRPSFESFLERVHEADRDRVARSMADAMDHAAAYETEFRAIGYDGIERWIMGKGKAWRNGKPLRMLGVFVDLTERHEVEQDLRNLGGQLIDAHEHERIRLSRELHDDFSQRVALLKLELDMFRSQLAGASPDLDGQVAKMSGDADEICAALRRLSHNLHPALLEQLGLEKSLRGFCRDYAEARRMAIDLQIANVLPALAPEMTICLYRIAQEALHNAAKHGAASRVILALAADGPEIVLRVADDGAGFDPVAARRKGTLGLISMRERARMIKGTLSLTSSPGAGTRIEVRAPLRKNV